MNTDFVPLSSLLESMKSPSFEGISTAKMESAVKEKPEPQERPQSKPQEDSKSAAHPPKEAPLEVPDHDKVCKEPKILLDRDGDKISRIRVLCTCGQSIVLDCKYST